MMADFGLPVSAGNFRFQAETRIVERLVHNVQYNGTVLDLGSGVGYWAEVFARHFSRVVAIEGSNVLYPSLATRCSPYDNLRAIHGNVLSFEPYVQMQMGCELIKKWKAFVSERFQMLQLTGSLTYWAMRLCYPLIKRLPKTLGIPFPYLENHFFVLKIKLVVNKENI